MNQSAAPRASGNFHFLAPEFAHINAAAQDAERLLGISPGMACASARTCLELVVQWLYEYRPELPSWVRHDPKANLYSLLQEDDFSSLVGGIIWDKMELVRRRGNLGAHGQRVSAAEALNLLEELFHILRWFAFKNTRDVALRPSPDLHFDKALLPQMVDVLEAAQFTKAKVAEEEKKAAEREAKHQAELQALWDRTEAREKELEAAVKAKLAAEQQAAKATQQAQRDAEAQAAHIRELEARSLRDIDAELAEKQAQLQQITPLPNDTYDYNEARTRQSLIDSGLCTAGWQFDEDMRREVPVTFAAAGVTKSGKGAVDYVLYGDDGKPLAVVEAKRTRKDATAGKQQAKLYADALEKESGQRPVMFYTNGFDTWLWDDQQGPAREVQGFYSKDDLVSLLTRRAMRSDPRAVAVNAEIAGRDYQARAIRALTDAFSRGQRSTLLTMATGTGKTRTAIALVDVLMRANWVKRVLFLADRKSLVKQATNAFKTHLSDTNPVNLVTEKATDSRVYVSTYPTMMNLIEKGNRVEGTAKRFGIGHFDLVIVDEAHRSVYQKYAAIFRYFDALLVGLTATPKAEVHADTYKVFGLSALEGPTDDYSLEQAITDGHLVPPVAFDVPVRFVREGIKYDELSEAEQAQWEALEWQQADDELPTEVAAGSVNKYLFNTDTVDKVLACLLENGIKVEGGERLGKTIIFAVNQKHAEFIADRFDAAYPEHKGVFARVITHDVSHAQSLIDEFSQKDSAPHIAISVDMLDTGIDVPEVVNLVFFKPVRSKVKFVQMIGRGTRLCPQLFGPAEDGSDDKREFYIFDCCQNFEYFNNKPEGVPSARQESVGKRLFTARVDLLSRLQAPVLDNAVAEPNPSYGEAEAVGDRLAAQLLDEVKGMNPSNLEVRPRYEHVQHFTNADAWQDLPNNEAAVERLKEKVAGLPSTHSRGDVRAKLFDLNCVYLQIALLEGAAVDKYQGRIVEVAAALQSKTNVPDVQAKIALIEEIQSVDYWQDVTVTMVDEVRRGLRGLVRFIDREQQVVVYTALEDTLGEVTTPAMDGVQIETSVPMYRRRVEAFIKKHQDHPAIKRLHYCEPLSVQDLADLEALVFDAEVGESEEVFAQAYPDKGSLPVFIRSLIGLDREAVMERFSDFLSTANYSAEQVAFVEQVIEHLTMQGRLEARMLFDAPFNSHHYKGLSGLFGEDDSRKIIGLVRSFEQDDAQPNA